MKFPWQNIKPEIKAKTPTNPGGDVIERPNIDFSVFKATIPRFLYKPPFGYPRPDNPPMLKQFARNGYIFSVISNLQEAAANCEWDIKPKNSDVEMTDELREKAAMIKDFLNNPNGNKEDWLHLIKTAVRDMCELDSAVWVKVFGRDGQLKQLFARDGATFLKNPDKFGYIGNRQDIIFPDHSLMNPMQDANLGSTSIDNSDFGHRFALAYAEKAAYYQYGWEMASLPIPFGKNEIIYMQKNPRSDTIYGISPVGVLADIILTLVYGSMYNLDFYQNSNTPEGIITLLGAPNDEVKAFKRRLDDQQKEIDPNTGFSRKVGFRMPVINREATFTPFQLPAREMQILEQQQWFTKVVWMAFGVSADDLGFTENSNKAVSEEQGKKYAKKAVKPFLNIIENRINQEILPEFDANDLCFQFDYYDLDEDVKRHQLYESQIRMGIKTSVMVAEEEQIDIEKLQQGKEEERQRQKEDMQAQFNNNNEPDVKALKMKPGVKVRCTTAGINNGKIGVIERKLADGSFQVRFDNSLVVLAKQELVIAGNDKEGMSKIKANKDPFDNTELEYEMKQQIEESAKKINKAISIYGKGALQNVS